MKRRDARALDHEALEEIRIRAVEQVQAGESPEVVIKALGFSRSCIYTWLAMYRAGGWGALNARYDPGAAVGGVLGEVEREQRGSAAAAIGFELPASVVPCHRTGPGEGPTLARRGVSGDPPGGVEGRSFDPVWR